MARPRRCAWSSSGPRQDCSRCCDRDLIEFLLFDVAHLWGLEDACELVTNAMCHGAGPVGVRLSCAADRLRAEVHDHGAGRPVRKHATGDDETGRGLELLDGLTGLHGGELGVVEDQHGPGKTVYVEVVLPGAASAW